MPEFADPKQFARLALGGIETGDESIEQGPIAELEKQQSLRRGRSLLGRNPKAKNRRLAQKAFNDVVELDPEGRFHRRDRRPRLADVVRIKPTSDRGYALHGSIEGRRGNGVPLLDSAFQRDRDARVGRHELKQ